MPPRNKTQANMMYTLQRAILKKGSWFTGITPPPAVTIVEGDDPENDGAMVVAKRTKRGWLNAFDGE